MWPDDRSAYEASLRERIKALTEMKLSDSDLYSRNHLARLRKQLAAHQKNENADFFEALRDHLTRLGWRTKNDDDCAEF